MKEAQDDFPEVVNKVMAKLRSARGARQEFFKDFPYSPSTVSNWMSGKTKARQEDRVLFIEKATDVYKRYHEKEIELVERKNRVSKDFQKLFA